MERPDDQHKSSAWEGMTSPGALLAGAIAGMVMRRTGVIGAVGAAAGAAWLYQKWQTEGRVPGLSPLPVHVRRQIIINRPRPEVFAFWRDPTNFPRFMKHVESVTRTGPDRHRWEVRAPMGATLSWDAEIYDVEEGRRIRWRAVPPAEISNEGVVRFDDAPDGTGTEVRLDITYDAPGGRLGAFIGKLMGEEPGTQAQGDLRRLKELLEAKRLP